jgi:hypothetical protein
MAAGITDPEDLSVWRGICYSGNNITSSASVRRLDGFGFAPSLNAFFRLFLLSLGEKITMLQATETIRHYQKLTDGLVEMWNRGYRFDDLRLYLDGYLSALRNANVMENYQINRLEEETMRYIYDPSNFEQIPFPETQAQSDYGYY